MGVLASDTADRQRVSAVGSDIDLDGGIGETEEGEGVGTGIRGHAALGEPQNAAVLVTQAEFTL